MEEYRFVRINEDLLPDLINLYKASFGKAFSLSYLRKKFNTNYTGISYIGFIAYDRHNSPAAYYGVFPCQLILNGEKILAAQSGDTMTHPLHQGKGLFTKLAQQTYMLVKESGIEFVFGFPNENSYPGFMKRLNWVDKGPMELYTIYIKTLPISSVIQFTKLRTLYMRLVASLMFNKTKDRVSVDSIVSNGQFGLNKSSQYIEYKSYETNFNALLNNKKLWLKIDHRLIIGDMELMTEKEFDKIIRKLKCRAWFSGIRRIVFATSPKTYYSEIFSNYPGVNKSITIHDCYLNDYSDKINPNLIKYTAADWDTF